MNDQLLSTRTDNTTPNSVRLDEQPCSTEVTNSELYALCKKTERWIGDLIEKVDDLQDREYCVNIDTKDPLGRSTKTQVYYGKLEEKSEESDVLDEFEPGDWSVICRADDDIVDSNDDDGCSFCADGELARNFDSFSSASISELISELAPPNYFRWLRLQRAGKFLCQISIWAMLGIGFAMAFDSVDDGKHREYKPLFLSAFTVLAVISSVKDAERYRPTYRD